MSSEQRQKTLTGRSWLGVLPHRSRAEVIASTLGAFFAIGAIALFSEILVSEKAAPLIVASMGAAAVLLFAAPRSTMSQPWPLVGGHLVSAFIGVSCAKFVPWFALSCALAVAGAILCMHLTCCLHPPGGAAALVAVIGGDHIQSLGYNYLFAPVLVNVLVILVVALVFNNLVPGQRYPWSGPPPS